MTPNDKLKECYGISSKINFKPEIALVLGSGLGDYANTAVDVYSTLDYADIKSFPQSTVEGHKGRFVFGYVNGVPVVVMQGKECIIMRDIL